MTTPKGGKTVTTTEKSATNYPQWSQDALQNLVGMGQSMNGPFLQTPSYGLAGFTPAQMKAFDLTGQMAEGAFMTPQAPVNAADAKVTAARVGPAAQSTTALARAAQIDPNAIQGMMNPYLTAVLAPAMKQATRARDENQAAIGARAAASGSFGGSREAIQRGQADRAYQEGTATMVADLMAKGWDQASALSQANAQMQQQTNLTNAGAENNSNLSNTAARNAANLAQAGFDQNANLYNAGVAGDLARLNSGLIDANFNRQQSALQSLLGIGTAQQQFAQGALNLPWDALARLASLTPQQLNSESTATSTAPNQAKSPLQNILGGVMSVAGMGATGGGSIGGNLLAKLSDERTKTNIQELGKDPQTGLMQYAYDYRSDVQAAEKSGTPMPPKRVGPMAQDVRKAGGRTKKVGGHLAILLGE